VYILYFIFKQIVLIGPQLVERSNRSAIKHISRVHAHKHATFVQVIDLLKTKIHVK